MAPYSHRPVLLIFLLLLLPFARNANADTIEILCTEYETCGKYEGTTADGTLIKADANPSSPSTGTGVFKPFVRIQENGKGADNNSGTQNGYNTDQKNPKTNFDTKAGKWTHSVLFGDLGTVTIGEISYYKFSLDANESGKANSKANLIDITDIQIFLSDDPNMYAPEQGSGYDGIPYYSHSNSLLGIEPEWTLDNDVNGDITVTLQASICDTNGQCGSGHGDLDLFIPETSLTALETDYLVFYSEYANASAGFEEWRYLAKPSVSIPVVSIPEPHSIQLMLMGLLLLIVKRRAHL